MRSINAIAGLVLAFAVALSSGASAVARGQADVAGSLVICTGSGTVMVDVDAEGQPVKRAHVCPDCLAASLDADLPPPAGAPFFPAPAEPVWRAPQGAACPAAPQLWFEARAPPQ